MAKISLGQNVYGVVVEKITREFYPVRATTKAGAMEAVKALSTVGDEYHVRPDLTVIYSRIPMQEIPAEKWNKAEFVEIDDANKNALLAEINRQEKVYSEALQKKREQENKEEE